MSIIDNYEPVKYTGNGVTKNFAFNFRGFDETYIKVRLEEIATGIQTLLTLTTDYTVTLDENTASGTVFLLVAPTSDYYIIITREMSYEQIVPYSNSRSFDAERIETGFDKNVALSQENREKLNRGVTLPIGTTGINLTIPVPVANRCIKYNSAGDNLEVSLYDPDEMVSLAEGFADDSETSSINAGLSETNALNSANLAESWAIDDIGDRPEGSSKYWAEQSELSVTGKANTDLDNLSATGQSILDGKASVNLDNLSTLGYYKLTYIPIATCSTAGATSEKVVVLPDFSLFTGATINVTFTNKNTANSPTLNVNGTGSIAIYNENGNIVSGSNLALFPAGATIEFYYNGTNWVFKNRVVDSGLSGILDSYTIYADGSIEQKGRRTGTGVTTTTVTFPVPFSKLERVIAGRTSHTSYAGTGYPYYWSAVSNVTLTSMQFGADYTNAPIQSWFAKGY